MSLSSASSFIGGIKEYVYQGIKSFPLVISSAVLIYTVSTGSIAFMNLFLGLGILMPIYTFVLQKILGIIFNYISPGSLFWRRDSSDICRIVPSYDKKDLQHFLGNQNTEVIPSYWLMNLSFFIGYCITNAVDSLNKSNCDSLSNEQDQRNTKALFIIVATSVFALLMLLLRFRYMSGCEGSGFLGILVSILCAGGAAVSGYGIYVASRVCGARTSDLFGILSQILPVSAMSQNPVVCTAN